MMRIINPSLLSSFEVCRLIYGGYISGYNIDVNSSSAKRIRDLTDIRLLH